MTKESYIEERLVKFREVGLKAEFIELIRVALASAWIEGEIDATRKLKEKFNEIFPPQKVTMTQSSYIQLAIEGFNNEKKILTEALTHDKLGNGVIDVRQRLHEVDTEIRILLANNKQK